MPEIDLSKAKIFTSSEELGHWLMVNHTIESQLWIKIHKKSSGLQSINWDEVVIESLRWGWIDGIKKSIDDKAYLQRISPRKAGSNWSKRNTKHVERLSKEGLMMEPGLVHVIRSA